MNVSNRSQVKVKFVSIKAVFLRLNPSVRIVFIINERVASEVKKAIT